LRLLLLLIKHELMSLSASKRTACGQRNLPHESDNNLPLGFVDAYPIETVRPKAANTPVLWQIDDEAGEAFEM